MMTSINSMIEVPNWLKTPQKLGLHLGENLIEEQPDMFDFVADVAGEETMATGPFRAEIKIFDASSCLNETQWQAEAKKMRTSSANCTLPILAKVEVRCKNRSTGDLQVILTDVSGVSSSTSTTTVEWARMMRQKKLAGLLWLANGDKEIPVLARSTDNTSSDTSNGTRHVPLATIKPTVRGKVTEAELSSGTTSLTLSIPSWQAKTKWLCFAFGCCVPTFGLAACFGLYKSAKANLVTNMTLQLTGSTYKQVLPDYVGELVDLEGLTDPVERFALLMLILFAEADRMTEPVSHGSYVDDGGLLFGGGDFGADM